MANVKLILVESIHRLGEAGDLVSVKPGFARNFLLPQGKALLATESRVKEFEHKRRIAEEKAAREMKDLQAVKKQLEALRVEIGARAGESGKLFGSVTTQQIADKVTATGLKIDRRRIDMREPIKEVGEHKVSVKLLRELVAQLTIVVVAEGGPSPEEEAAEEEVDDRRDRRRRRDRDDDEDDDEDEDERDRTRGEDSAPRE
jgi:large subunit ribosomal protein L9